MTSYGEKSKEAQNKKQKENKTQVIFTCLENTHESKQRKQIDKYPDRNPNCKTGLWTDFRETQARILPNSPFSAGPALREHR